MSARPQLNGTTKVGTNNLPHPQLGGHAKKHRSAIHISKQGAARSACPSCCIRDDDARVCEPKDRNEFIGGQLHFLGSPESPTRAHCDIAAIANSIEPAGRNIIPSKTLGGRNPTEFPAYRLPKLEDGPVLADLSRPIVLAMAKSVTAHPSLRKMGLERNCAGDPACIFIENAVGCRRNMAGAHQNSCAFLRTRLNFPNGSPRIVWVGHDASAIGRSNRSCWQCGGENKDKGANYCRAKSRHNGPHTTI